MDADFHRIHKMKTASEGLDNGFLDRPKQGRCLWQISARQPQGMVKLFCMEDPAKGVFSWEFIGPCHVDADIGLIPTEGGPNFPSTLAEGDSRPTMLSQQEMGLAKRIMYHLNRKSISVGGMMALAKGTCHRHKMIPQDGDQAVFSSCVCPLPQG
jgi:hypothetical protein